MRPHNKILIAFVGMPGAGKSEATRHLQDKNFPFVRFGDATEKVLAQKGLAVTAENERTVRESLRKELGMAAYAIKALPKIDLLLEKHDVIALDGIYSWEEYVFLKPKYPGLLLVHIYAKPQIRYQRLKERSVRSLTLEEAKERDLMELEHLNKGGPIAIADYLIENNSEDLGQLYKNLDTMLNHLGVI